MKKQIGTLSILVIALTALVLLLAGCDTGGGDGGGTNELAISIDGAAARTYTVTAAA